MRLPSLKVGAGPHSYPVYRLTTMQNAFTSDLKYISDHLTDGRPGSSSPGCAQGQHPPQAYRVIDDHMYEDTRFVVNGSRVPRRLHVAVPVLETMRHFRLSG